MTGLAVTGVGSLLHNLERFVPLSPHDKQAIAELASAPLIKVKARNDLAREGQVPQVVRLIVSGWASRYKDLPDGRRQVVGYFIPGDFCDLNVYIVQRLDHSIGALTPVTYLAVPPELLQQIIQERPRFGQALLWHELVSTSIMREWLLNIGQRSAYERIAHLFVEIYVRMRAIGQTFDQSCEFPLTQSDLAEAVGLTSVHVNRTLQDLRREGLIELKQRRLTILDFDRLKQIAMFNSNYLHLHQDGRTLEAND